MKIWPIISKLFELLNDYVCLTPNEKMQVRILQVPLSKASPMPCEPPNLLNLIGSVEAWVKLKLTIMALWSSTLPLLPSPPFIFYYSFLFSFFSWFFFFYCCCHCVTTMTKTTRRRAPHLSFFSITTTIKVTSLVMTTIKG